MISNHIRTPALRLALAAAVLTVLLISVSVARATPPSITDAFTHGDDGWEIYEGSSEYDASWNPSGGNPGGYISYDDTDPALSQAVFADEHYVSRISRYIGISDIVFDLRTAAAAERSPRVWITDPDDPSFPAIHSDLRRAPNSSWQHYTLPLDAGAARWVDGDGEQVGPARFRKILDRDPVFVVRADYSSAAAEKTDFDSVGIQQFVPRAISLKYRPKTGKLKGRLTTTTVDRPICTSGQKVLFKKKLTGGGDRQVGKTTTNGAGRFVLSRKHLAPGRYYALAPESKPTGADCLQAKSETIRVKR